MPSKDGKNTARTKLATERKKIKFPKPGELVLTSPALCSYCNYSSVIGGNSFYLCDYYLITKKMRGCKYGTCDKFEKRINKIKTKPKMQF